MSKPITFVAICAAAALVAKLGGAPSRAICGVCFNEFTHMNTKCPQCKRLIAEALQVRQTEASATT